MADISLQGVSTWCFSLSLGQSMMVASSIGFHYHEGAGLPREVTAGDEQAA